MGATTSRRRGHIEQRPGGSYRVSVHAGIDPITHRRRYLRETAPTKREAEKARTRLQSQVDEKRHPKSNATLGELLDQWMAVSSHVTSTQERYADLIRLYLKPAFGKTAVGKIDAELLAANSIRKIHFIVRAALDLGVRWRHLGVNEAEIARPPAFERCHVAVAGGRTHLALSGCHPRAQRGRRADVSERPSLPHELHGHLVLAEVDQDEGLLGGGMGEERALHGSERRRCAGITDSRASSPVQRPPS